MLLATGTGEGTGFRLMGSIPDQRPLFPWMYPHMLQPALPSTAPIDPCAHLPSSSSLSPHTSDCLTRAGAEAGCPG